MNYQSSYKISDFAIDVNKEANRLNAQVELFWNNELKIYKSLGLKDGMKIVECGCGPGLIGQKLHQALPKSYITAFEIDPILVQVADAKAKELKLDRYEVAQRSILETGLPDNTFDFAVTRLVLEHLSDPVQAVKEVARILKPGGMAVFVDNDFEYHMRTHPDIPELTSLYHAYCDARIADGGNPRIGRELPQVLKSAGLSNVHLEIVCAHNKVIGDEIFLQSEGSGVPIKLVQDGYLPKETYSKISIGWNRMMKDPQHSIFRQLFIGVGYKTENPDSQTPFVPEPKKNLKQYVESAGKNYEAPIGALEKQVSSIWEEVLGREKIGRNDNFFEAGGSSVEVPEIVEKLNDISQSDLTIIDLFDNPTVALLAKLLLPKEPQPSSPLTSTDRKKLREEKLQERRNKMRKFRKE